MTVTLQNTLIDLIDNVTQTNKSDNFWRAVVTNVTHVGMVTPDGRLVAGESIRKVQVVRPGENLPDPTYYPVICSPVPVVGDDVWMMSPNGKPAVCVGIAFAVLRNSQTIWGTGAESDWRSVFATPTAVTGIAPVLPAGIYHITGTWTIGNNNSSHSVGYGLRIGGTIQEGTGLLKLVVGTIHSATMSWDVELAIPSTVYMVAWNDVDDGSTSHKMWNAFNQLHWEKIT